MTNPDIDYLDFKFKSSSFQPIMGEKLSTLSELRHYRGHDFLSEGDQSGGYFEKARGTKLEIAHRKTLLLELRAK